MTLTFEEQVNIINSLQMKDITEISHLVNHSNINEPLMVSKSTALHIAAMVGDIEIIKFLISCGADLDARNSKQLTPLHIACLVGHTEVVSLLITEHNLNAQDENGTTPLQFACYNSHYELAKTLIEEYKADHTIINRNGWHLSHFAAISGNVELLQYLVNSDAVDIHSTTSYTDYLYDEIHYQPQPQNWYEELLYHTLKISQEQYKAPIAGGNTLLHLACRAGRSELVLYLIETLGVKVEVTDDAQFTPLVAACLSGNIDTIKLLVERYNATINPAIDGAPTPLWAACHDNNAEIVRYLCQRGAKVDVKCEDKTLLVEAYTYSSLEIIQLLIEEQGHIPRYAAGGKEELFAAAANKDTRVLQYLITKYTVTPDWDLLREVCQKGTLTTVRYLVEECNVSLELLPHPDDMPVYSQDTLLYRTSWNSNAGVFRYILGKSTPAMLKQAGFNFEDSCSALEIQLLHNAFGSGSLDNVQLLLERYGDKLQSHYGVLLEYAARNDNPAVLKYLLNNDKFTAHLPADFSYLPALQSACRHGAPENIRLLCSVAGHINDHDSAILHSACRHFSSVRPLIYLLDAENYHNETLTRDNEWKNQALLCAREVDVIKYLLARGADINATDENGATLLHIMCSSADLDVVIYLIAAGANIHKTDNAGLSPLHYACVHESLHIAKYLIEKCGIDPNTKTAEGLTALHAACLSELGELVKYLLGDCKVDINTSTVDGMSVRDIAKIFATFPATKYIALYPLSDATIEDYTEEASDLAFLAFASEERRILHATNINCAKSIHTLMWNQQWNGYRWRSIFFPNEFFHSLCQIEYWGMIEYLVREKRVDINATNPLSQTALMQAYKNNQLELVQFLIGLGANVNVTDYNGLTLLHLAYCDGNFELVKQLVAHGADVLATCQSPHAFSVLHDVCANGQLELLKYFVEECRIGIDIINQSTHESALYIACRNGQLATVQYLIATGADVEKTDSNNTPLLAIACWSCNIELVKYLAENVNLSLLAPGQTGHLYIHDPEIILYLLEKKLININETNNILDNAYTCGQLEIVQCLAEHGVNLNTVDIHGRAPIELAYSMGHIEIVKFLVTNTVDKEQAAPIFSKLLFVALQKDHLEIAHSLVEHGANVNAVDAFGRAPIELAYSMGHIEIVKFLVTNTVDKEQAAPIFSKLLLKACQDGNLEIVQCLAEHGANVNAVDECERTPLYFACEKGNLEIVQCLAEHGANVNAVDVFGRAPIELAYSMGHIEIVKFLITNTVDKEQAAPIFSKLLFVALQNDQLEILQCLAEHGANVNAVDAFGRTPLYLACEKGDLATAKTLIALGADINIPDRWGTLPLQSARSNGHTEIEEYLLHGIHNSDHSLGHTEPVGSVEDSTAGLLGETETS